MNGGLVIVVGEKLGGRGESNSPSPTSELEKDEKMENKSEKISVSIPEDMLPEGCEEGDSVSLIGVVSYGEDGSALVDVESVQKAKSKQAKEPEEEDAVNFANEMDEQGEYLG